VISSIFYHLQAHWAHLVDMKIYLGLSIFNISSVVWLRTLFAMRMCEFLIYLVFYSYINACNIHWSQYVLIIQGLSKVWKPLNISQTVHFRKKCFRQKLFGFEGAIRRYHWFDLEESFEGHFNFLKWNTLYIFANSCSLSR